MGRLNVLYDHQTFTLQRVGGVSNSFAQLIRQFDSRDYGVRPWVGCLFSANDHLAAAGRRPLPVPGAGPLAVPGARLVNRAYSKAMAAAADILHPTFYSVRDLPQTSNKPVVATVHDMAPERLPAQFPAGNPHRGKRAHCDRADVIVCVSETTRADLLRLYGYGRERTRVVYHGIDLARAQQDVTLPRGLPERYALYIGRRDSYKNFPLVLRALAALHKRGWDLHFVAAGGEPFADQEAELIRELGLAGYVHRVAPSDAALRGLLRAAAVFVHPSFYEGFGLPILEAFAQGCPVALAEASCFPEIAAEAALYFDPHASESCAQAIERSLLEANRDRVAAGLARCRTFSWEQAAADLAAVYREVA